MRAFRVLLVHELRMTWLSWTTWASWALFLALLGTIHWYAVLACSRTPMPWTPAEAVFRWFPLPLLCILPLLTMRTFAEERRAGTLGALLTTPASAFAVVAAKFACTWSTWVVFWASFALFPLIASEALGDSADPRLLDTVTLGGGVSFIAVSGLLHVAIGLLCSSRTRSPGLAALMTFVCLLGLTVSGGLIDALPSDGWEWLGWMKGPAEHLRTLGHLEDFASGIIDTRPLALYLTGCALCLGLTVVNVEAAD
jgi:ABC-2 type transport system permease protein